jgi:hypothetical protein
MVDSRIPDIMLKTKQEGRCEFGSPKLNWLDDVKAAIKTVGLDRWRPKQERMEGDPKGS